MKNTAKIALVVLCTQYLTIAATAKSRLDSFGFRLSVAEERIAKRRAARQAGEDGGALLFGTRAEARLVGAVHRYEAIVRKGGWQTIPRGKPLDTVNDQSR